MLIEICIRNTRAFLWIYYYSRKAINIREIGFAKLHFYCKRMCLRTTVAKCHQWHANAAFLIVPEKGRGVALLRFYAVKAVLYVASY
ncbi:hypothetical protein RB195_015025 [Necator americanus]|uniref:Uncharacterized protein n=1 Tax=Necator americanus TaxID=51031 RepID=A0ABR1E2T5_NECAM